MRFGEITPIKPIAHCPTQTSDFVRKQQTLLSLLALFWLLFLSLPSWHSSPELTNLLAPRLSELAGTIKSKSLVLEMGKWSSREFRCLALDHTANKIIIWGRENRCPDSQSSDDSYLNLYLKAPQRSFCCLKVYTPRRSSALLINTKQGCSGFCWFESYQQLKSLHTLTGLN